MHRTTACPHRTLTWRWPARIRADRWNPAVGWACRLRTDEQEDGGDTLRPSIQTQRLTFREYTLDDERDVLRLFADEQARRFYPEMTGPADARRWIEWNLRNYNEHGFGLWVLQLTSTSEFVGDCGLTYQDVESRQELEIGYHVLEHLRGRGYATEAARACLDFGFRHTGHDMICSIVRPDNAGSTGVAGRIHAGCRTFMKRGTPCLLYYTARDEWTAAEPEEGS